MDHGCNITQAQEGGVKGFKPSSYYNFSWNSVITIGDFNKWVANTSPAGFNFDGRYFFGSKDHTMLVAALKAADLVTTLSSNGPFRVFAPTNAVFDKIPADALTNLLKPENKTTLAGILTYHVIAGNVDAATLTDLIKKSKGTAVVKTVNGQELKASIENGKVVLTDAKDGKVTVISADLKASNGVIHVTDAVSMPE